MTDSRRRVYRPTPQQQADRRAWLEIKQQDEAHTREMQRSEQMAHRQSEAGLVEKFPDREPIRQRIGEVRARLMEVFDEAQAVQAANERMKAASQPDRERFGRSAGGGIR